MTRCALMLAATFALPGCLDYETIAQLFQDHFPDGEVVQIAIPPRPAERRPVGAVGVSDSRDR